MSEVGLTIAICTRNRSACLGRCLAALEAAERPDSRFEVVVVANDCSDDTLAVARGFVGRLPIVVAVEPLAGLSNARNRAIATARGRLIVWIDDDALARPGLLRAYEAAMAAWPQCAIFGGTIIPMLEGEPPDWLLEGLDCVETAYAARRPALALPFDGQGWDIPYGANFAMSAEVQRRFAFDPRLGRRPSDPLAGGEEMAVIGAALAAGHLGHWVPEAVIDHVIGVERQTEDWLWRYFHAEGRHTACVGSDSIWKRLKAGRARRRYRRARHKLPPQEWLWLLVRAAMLAGQAGLSLPR